MWGCIKSELTQLRDDHVPTCEVGSKKVKFKGDFPLPVEVRNLIKEKRRAHRRWIQHANRPDVEIFRREYTRIRNSCTRAVRKAQRAFERDVAARSKKDNKLFWGLTKKRLKTKVGIAPLRKDPQDDSSLKFDDEAKAEILQTRENPTVIFQLFRVALMPLSLTSFSLKMMSSRSCSHSVQTRALGLMVFTRGCLRNWLRYCVASSPYSSRNQLIRGSYHKTGRRLKSHQSSRKARIM